MDVVVWLRSLGLGKYEAAFRENEISEKVLPSLTAEDLKELGVAALGHRRRASNQSILRLDTAGSCPSRVAVRAQRIEIIPFGEETHDSSHHAAPCQCRHRRGPDLAGAR